MVLHLVAVQPVVAFTSAQQLAIFTQSPLLQRGEIWPVPFQIASKKLLLFCLAFILSHGFQGVQHEHQILAIMLFQDFVQVSPQFPIYP